MVCDILVVACIFTFPLHLQAARVHKELPKFIKTCQNNENLSKCARQTLEELRPYLVEGIQELQVPPIDPLFIPAMYLSKRSSHLANFQSNITDLQWTGVRNFEILEILIDPEEYAFRLKINFPKAHLDFLAFLLGTVLSFDAHGDGGVSVTFTNLNMDIVLNGERYIQGGQEFVKWKKEDIDINFDGVYFEDIFGFFSDPSLSKLFHVAVNNGARLIGSTLRSLIEYSLGNSIFECINRIHTKFSLEVLYPSI